MQTGYGADSVRSRDLRVNCLHPRVESGVESRVEIHAIIRLTTSCGGVLGTMAGVEQLIKLSAKTILTKPIWVAVTPILYQSIAKGSYVQ